MVRLGDVCEINLGRTPPRGDRRCWDKEKNSKFVWVSISDMGNLKDGQVVDSKEYVTQFAIDSAALPKVEKGTLLLSFKLTLGRTAIAGCDLYTNEAIAALPIKQEYSDKVDLQYLIEFFSFFDWAAFAASDEKLLGKTLNKKKLAEVPVLIPPLAVQREIVARLEKELGEAEKVAAKFKRLAELADETFKAELDETFNTIEGEKVRLGDVCKRLSSGKFIAASDIKRDGEIPVFGANGLRGYACVSNFDGECVIIGRQGALCGNVRYYNGCAYMTDHAIVATFKTSVDAVFMMHQLGNMNLGQLSKQAAQPGLAVSVLAMQYITLPPLATQRAIVAKLDAAKERCEKLKTAASRGLAAAENLRKAILAEAFQ